MATEEFLEIYYKGLAQKSNWETGLSDDFKFIRGEMPKPTPVIGKGLTGGRSATIIPRTLLTKKRARAGSIVRVITMRAI